MTLDEMRIPEERLSDRRTYLTPLNFATNFAFFRDTDGTEEGEAGTGHPHPARHGQLLGRLRGRKPAAALHPVRCRRHPAGGVGGGAGPAERHDRDRQRRRWRRRFGLGPFVGQLFLHAVSIRGHDIVKYALDTYGDDGAVLSCTHDANAWPSDFYAGLPAPDGGERVILWIQNSHPRAIPPGEVGLRPMGGGDNTAAFLDQPVAPFATMALDTRALLPEAAYPAQIEVLAGKHMVRPRYEIVNAAGRRRIAHVNVERVDLEPDPRLPELGSLMGKGHILPAPVLPTDRFRTRALPTPMATTQRHLPLMATVYDASGGEVAQHRFGTLKRTDSVWLEIDALLSGAGRSLPSGYGHVELVYDFDPTTEGGMEADGWLHGIFRYEARDGGPCGRDQLRQSHVQHRAGLPQRAAELCRPAAGADHAAVPAHRPGRRRRGRPALGRVLPPGLPGLDAVAPAQRPPG